MNNQNLVIRNYFFNKDIDNAYLSKISKKLKKSVQQINLEINNRNKNLNILRDKLSLNFNFNELKKFKKFKSIVIIGMGGSILGIEAIFQFLEEKIKKKVYFFDNLDIEKLKKFKSNNKNKNILYLIISKSGDTTETLSNLFFLDIIKKNSKNIIILTEKKNNHLFNIAKKMGLFFVEHKKHIGGRFSVLSEVGILPAYLMGLDIFRLRQNSKKFLSGKNLKTLCDSSRKLVNLHKKNKKIIIFLNYVPRLQKFLEWSQQLIAESLGKKGKGFLPFISNVPKDHHSLLQLYLDGPQDKIFYIFSQNEKDKFLLNTKKFYSKIKYLHNKKLSEVKNAQKNALIQSLIKHKISHRELKLKKIDESCIGELFSYNILETVLIAKLLSINPYDQPAVEEVKINTKNILK